MPAEKFRHVSEMSRARWRHRIEAPAHRLAAVLDFWRHAVPRQIPRGVAKFRNQEEANQAREEWLTGEVRRLERERRARHR